VDDYETTWKEGQKGQYPFGMVSAKHHLLHTKEWNLGNLKARAIPRLLGMMQVKEIRYFPSRSRSIAYSNLALEKEGAIQYHCYCIRRGHHSWRLQLPSRVVDVSAYFAESAGPRMDFPRSKCWKSSNVLVMKTDSFLKVLAQQKYLKTRNDSFAMTSSLSRDVIRERSWTFLWQSFH
jgi:hypothetical protein